MERNGDVVTKAEIDDNEDESSVQEPDEPVKSIILSPCPLQQKMETVMNTGRGLKTAKYTEKASLFQWILRVAGISFITLILVLLLIILLIPNKNRVSEKEEIREEIDVKGNVISFVNTKFKAPATDMIKTAFLNISREVK